MKKTCDDSVIQNGGTIDKMILQPNIMNTSFDSSLMHSTSPAGIAQQQQQQQILSPTTTTTTNTILTSDKIEERQNEMLKKHEMERMKRKSVIKYLIIMNEMIIIFTFLVCI